MTGFVITMIVLSAIILLCVGWFVAQLMKSADAAELLLVPRARKIKRTKRSLWARLGDFWAYWWIGGMTLRNAWKRSGEVLS